MAEGSLVKIGFFVLDKLLFFLRRERKSLCYQIVSKFPLISVAPHIQHSDWNITAAENLDGYHIRVTNDGNVPITDQLLTFTFDPDSLIYHVDYATVPRGAHGEISEAETEEPNVRTYSFKLLNPFKRFRDEISFFLLVGNSKTRPIVSARAPNLLCHQFRRERKTFWLWAGVGCGTLFTVLLLFYSVNGLFFGHQISGTFNSILLWFFLLFSVVLLVSYVSSFKRFLRFKKTGN